jgi:SAM-dependent methyltransferase
MRKAMTSHPDSAEVSSPIDFHDLAQARAWAEDTVRERPWRPRFFEAFADALNAERAGPLEVVELGSGPGHLAREVLSRCDVSRYVALDISPAMHALAREHLGALAERVTFLTRDFRDADWSAGLGGVDAIVTLQAVHEVRHKDRQPALFERAHDALRPGGLFLICDHYWEAGVSWKQVPLYLTPDERMATLSAAGFGELSVLHDEGGMSLIAARGV